MKRILVLLLTLCLSASWGLPYAPAEENRPEGDPWLNTDIFGRWPSERPAPEAHFELFANFDFYRRALEKGDSASTSISLRADAATWDKILSLCEDSGKTDAECESLRILYGFFSDRETVKKDGPAYLMAYVERVKAVKTLDELTALMGEEGFLFGTPFFSCNMLLTMTEPRTYCFYVGRTPLIEDRELTEEEIEADPEAQPQKDTEGTLRKLKLMGYGDEEAALLLEGLLRLGSGSAEIYEQTARENELGNKPALTLEEVGELCPAVGAILRGKGFVKDGAENEAAYNVSFSEIADFRGIYTEENLELLKAAVALSMFTAAEGWLGRAAFGGEEEDPDPRAIVSRFPSILVSQAFVHSFVPEERFREYDQLVNDLKAAMRRRIENSAWASAAAREKAYEKLDRMVTVSLLYHWEYDCEPLRTALRSCENALEAAARCVVFNRKCDMRYVGMAPFRGDRHVSNESPLTSGGKYYPMENAIYIGAGSLIGEMFNDESKETVLATLGYHIGHELSHGFDNTGMMYDALGAQVPLFSEEDMRIYMERVNRVVERVDRIRLLDDLNVLGSQQIGEIIADTEGLRLALDVAKQYENFDYDAFFRAYAKFYTWYYSDRETYRATFESEVHPSPFVRVNLTVQMMDEFYETYPSVAEGTPMYLAPEERQLVW